MTTLLRSLAATAMAALFLSAAHARAADPPATTITVPEMDCAGCAKKLGGKLTAVPGVAKVEYDVETRIIRVTPKGGAGLSPRALWEAVEKGGKGPGKLEGPAGTFTTKPAN